ncbi:MAG: OmpA family protein [Gammaproteobacteria bacterium]
MMGAFHDPLAGADSHQDEEPEVAAPVWSVFGDLMAGLVGAFVLVFIGVLLTQVDLVNSLQAEIGRRQQEEARRMALEKALAVPLASGRVTLNDGRIGISGSVLFDLNSARLRAEGEQLLQALVPPLQVYLEARDDMLMVSGFTDDQPIVAGNAQFRDNLDLSAQRALTVTRTLIAQGMPRSRVFSAAFGAEQPVASNADEKGRALNRRVEMAPVPRNRAAAEGSTAAPKAVTTP